MYYIYIYSAHLHVKHASYYYGSWAKVGGLWESSFR